ncbi:GGDEF domain-containing protein [Catenovulum sp. SM1970]|uniref:GGDEF domain-containing protein n=1 Tax=Marinifaba aquimaris TaxID=2741323 RepID=UPI0015719593|nr:GGDEF domain-containing protein [Marinifaba aquimaris]NTS76094.1 GGDEF domain-containing protein [Marinifaba aquimaris]
MDNLHCYNFIEPSSTKPNLSVARLTGDFQPNFNHLVEQLQTSLKIPHILQIFADEAAKFVRLTGIQFQSDENSYTNSEYTNGSTQYFSDLNQDHHDLGYITYHSNTVFSTADIQILKTLQQKLFYPLKNALVVLQLQKQALKDHLTQLGNRAHFDDILEKAISRTLRNNQDLTILLLDLDNFKRANDTFGHSEGDKVLIEFANEINHAIRNTDFAFRFGGDEFAIILEGANELVARRVAKQIKANIASNEQIKKAQVSTSIGYTCWQTTDTASSFFNRADGALYQAKNEGRNCLRYA